MIMQDSANIETLLNNNFFPDPEIRKEIYTLIESGVKNMFASIPQTP